jgi:excisionase family DNA binding protein
MDTTPWLTVEQAAERLGISTKTIRRMITRGEVEASRFGPRLIRINPVSLMESGHPLQYIE